MKKLPEYSNAMGVLMLLKGEYEHAEEYHLLLVKRHKDNNDVVNLDGDAWVALNQLKRVR